MILSPGSKRASTPRFCVISLLDTQPDQRFETNVLAPLGDIPMSAFQVL